MIDKITMSAFEGTFLDIAFRDCGINSFVIVGIALEVGIEPTVRHGMDLGYIPVVVRTNPLDEGIDQYLGMGDGPVDRSERVGDSRLHW